MLNTPGILGIKGLIPSGCEDDNFLLTIHSDDTRIAVTLE